MIDVDPYMTRATRTFMKSSRYGHAVGRIMIREGALLNWQRVERLIESDYPEAVRVLLEADIGKYLEGVTVAAEIEAGLLRFIKDEYRFMDDICAGTHVAEFMHLKYDIHNVKALFKSVHFDAPEIDLFSELGAVDVEELRQSVEKMRSGYLPPFTEELIEEVRGGLERKGEDPQRVDTIADRLFVERRLELSRMEGSRFLVSYSRAVIDVANLRVLLRGLELGKGREFFEEALADGGKLSRGSMLELSGEAFDRLSSRLLSTRYGRMLAPVLDVGDRRVRLSSLDRASDEYLLDVAASFSRITVGPERIIKYMLRREDEVTLVRIVLMGKLHGLSAASIEERLSSAFIWEGF